VSRPPHRRECSGDKVLTVGCGCAGSSPMHGIWGAAEVGDLTEVKRLVGEDPGLLNPEDEIYSRTPLMWASRGGHVEVVRWLLDQGAAIGTALCYASSQCRTPVVRLLLDRGADPTVTNANVDWSIDRDCTPLLHASNGGHLETVRLLLDHPGAAATINYFDRYDRTALMCACQRGHLGVVRALLEKGADPTITDSHGLTPMDIARRFYNLACIKALQVRSRFAPLPALVC
jgi:ankyrin repeat protein